MTDHPDYVALLAACCGANDRGIDWLTVVDADTPRLALADWLDDHGQGEQAAFIRAGCRDAGSLVSYPEVRGFGEWMASHAEWGYVGDIWRRNVTRLSRGFPSEVSMSAADWVQIGDALSWHPSESRPCPPTACPGLTVRLTDFGIRMTGPTRRGGLWTLSAESGGMSAQRQVQADEFARVRGALSRMDRHDYGSDRNRQLWVEVLSGIWPGVRAWHLPEPRDQYAHWRRAAEDALIARHALPATFMGETRP